jgi:hypothetical protein
MNRILLFCLIAFFATSCAKKTVAPFAPSPVTSEVSKPVVSEGEKQMVMNEVVPTNQVEENDIESASFAVAAPIVTKAKHKSAFIHVDRIIDAKPVTQFIKKASYSKKSAQVHGPRNWAPQLKIGLSLLAIGVVLAVFGLGFVGGLAALIGLLFTIVGLLVTY